jgi:hypothetical protein
LTRSRARSPALNIFEQDFVKRGSLFYTVPKRDFSVPDDCGEYVIEIVCDAPCQRANGFHFLPLTDACLELNFIAHIPLDRHDNW